MKLVRTGDFLCASRITGPHHNLLQLQLSIGPAASPKLESLPGVGSCTHTELDQGKLLSAVLEGISAANQDLGTFYSATHIRYVVNDTPPESVYGSMASAIVRELESGGSFGA